jgi:hypothetical protein
MAMTAPEAQRVVIATVAAPGDPGSVTVHACLTDSAAGFGGSVAFGDLDGDGAQDLVVGNDDPSSSDVRVYLGSAMPVSGCGDWGAPPLVIACPEGAGEATCNGSGFGASVAAGDVDGDGVDNLVVGAPLATIGSEARVGVVYTFPTGASGPDPAGATSRTHSQPKANDEVGREIALLPTGLETAARVEPMAGSIGREAVLGFTCTGIAGDRLEDTDVVGDLCAPR